MSSTLYAAALSFCNQFLIALPLSCFIWASSSTAWIVENQARKTFKLIFKTEKQWKFPFNERSDIFNHNLKKSFSHMCRVKLNCNTNKQWVQNYCFWCHEQLVTSYKYTNSEINKYILFVSWKLHMESQSTLLSLYNLQRKKE